jgi:hypothetical protein
MGLAVADAAILLPVSEDTPRNECRRFLGAVEFKTDVRVEGADILSFYSRLGVAVLGTVMDGDCGIDTMCAMLHRPQTEDERMEIREDLHYYLMDRIR